MKCEHCYRDGAGHYCMLFSMPDKDYPHEHLRVFCFGDEKSLSCKKKERRQYV